MKLIPGKWYTFPDDQSENGRFFVGYQSDGQAVFENPFFFPITTYLTGDIGWFDFERLPKNGS